MAKLTVFFKSKVIHSSLFENGIVRIGRDETNDVSIDSLAVAPAHAVIILSDDDCTIKQLNDEFPLTINGEHLKTALLKNNDTISMGKHELIFNTTVSVASSATFNSLIDQDVKILNQGIGNESSIPAANFQVMTGNNIGKILPLKKPMTRLGHRGKGVILILKKQEGYFVSVLENSRSITVNNEPLSDNLLKLNMNDVLNIDNISLQFFFN